MPVKQPPAIPRRALFRAGGAALSGLVFRGRAAALQTTPPAGIFDGRFVPEGADCKVVFVSDQHYWPGHLENWGGGGQITTSTDRRMPDLAAALNEERPGLSIHGGDVISAGGSFFPTPEEYARQLAFAQSFYRKLSHPYAPMLGNHETLEALYQDEAQLADWSRHFGPPYRFHDLKGWRFVCLNCLLPNPQGRHGRGDGYGNAFGIDAAQLEWLSRTLKDACSKRLHVVVCTHVPPRAWVNAAAFEQAISGAGCVRAVVCGHVHRNSAGQLGGIPVITRTANVTTPFGFTVIHCYPGGRLIMVQKSQHFPFEDFISARFYSTSPLGAESDRYLTLGGASEQLPLTGLKVIGADAQAVIQDGHLRLASKSGRALVLFDTAALGEARLGLTAVKAEGDRIGALALAGPDGAGGVEAALTSRYSPDGKVYLARGESNAREVLARSWFNIGDSIAYRLTLEVRGGRIRASWKNMLDLEAPAGRAASGQFGFFVDRGTMFVTDLKLEQLA